MSTTLIFAQGLQNHQSGLIDQAERSYRQVLLAEPSHVDALHLLGVVQHQQGLNAEAIASITRAIDLMIEQKASDVRRAEALSNLAAVLRATMQWDEAERYGRMAAAADPRSAGACQNVGCILLDKGDSAGAVEWHERALQLGCDPGQGMSNLGDALVSSGRLAEGTAMLERAIQIAPGSVEAHWNLSLAYLSAGDFRRGFAEHEWRLRKPNSAAARFPQPMWKGDPLAGRTILLHMEQGFGDAIQFARYVRHVAAMGGRVIVECYAPLVRLFADLAGVHQVVERGKTLPPFDIHTPLFSLPHLFGTTLTTVPAQVPYLRVDPALLERWRHLTATPSPTRKIGLVWAGNRDHRNDPNRSMALSQLAPLAEVPGVRWFSLQTGSNMTDAPPHGLELTNLTSHIADFADSAAFLSNLDLLISVDTAPVHIAGALGLPAWLLLPFAPDWRWLTDREDTVWYPTLRLFRQKRAGDWQGVVQRVVAELQAGSRR